VLGLSVEQVKSWSRSTRGIPAPYWHKIVSLSRRQRLGVTIEELARTKPQLGAICTPSLCAVQK